MTSKLDKRYHSTYEYKKQYALRTAQNAPNFLTCTKCKVEKPIESFWKNAGNIYGRHSKCNSCLNQYSSEFYRRDEGRRKRIIKQATKSNRQRKYKITPTEFDDLLQKQENKCAICTVILDESTFSLKPQLDHCHETKRIRGILCGMCNTALGLFKDDITIIKSSLAYLGKFND